MAVCPRCGAHSEEVGALCDTDGYFFIEEGDQAECPDDEVLGRYVGDRFAVMSLLGGGGMGKVYKAIQRPVGRRVALKVLKASLQENDRFLQRFQREAEAIATLNHPNIVTLYDFGRDENIHYIAMEYVEGRLLTPFLREPLEVPFVIHVTAQVLAALQEAHTRGIIHRDLKPDNVMITSVGGDDVFVKVLDFGLAQLATQDVAITAAGEVFGTPLYMSPEQAAGEEIGPQADLYSLGCIIYELLSGRPPFQGTRPMNVLMKHVNAPIPPLELKPGIAISTDLESILMRCLAKHPHERHATARALLDDIFQTPEGRMLSTSLPSVTRSLELPLVPPGERASHNTLANPSNPRKLADVGTPVGGTPLNITMPPVPPESTPGQTAPPDKRKRLFTVLGAVAGVLLLVTVVAFAVTSGNGASSDVNAADARSESSELGAVTAARANLHDAFTRAHRQANARLAVRPLTRALADPVSYDPGEITVRNAKIRGEAWHEQVKIFHRRELSASSYTDPIALVFGE